MRRKIYHSISALLIGVFFCLNVIPAFSISGPGFSEDVRIVKIKIAAAVEFKMSRMWWLQMHKMIRDVGRGFKGRFGIGFKVKEIEFWRPESGSRSLPELLNDLIEKVPRGECHLVIGIVPSWLSPGPPYGAADYIRACVLMKDHPSKSGLRNVLEHELCHIFGAIDVDEEGSIMSFDGRGGRYDDFTMRVMTLNRNRSFSEGEFRLAPEVMDEVTALYQKRLDQQEAGRSPWSAEERELQIVLSHLYQEKSRHADLNH